MTKIRTARRAAAGQQYAIVVGLIAVIAIASISFVGSSVKQLMVKVGNTVSSAENSTAPVTPQTVSGLSFTSLTNQAWNAVIPSNTATLTGFTGTVNVSVSGTGSPQVSINGGPFGSGGAISAGQTVQVRVTSPNAANQTVTATVTAGTATANFAVTTITNGGPWAFTTCGASGYAGPAQGNCNSAYSSTTLNGLVTVSSGIQSWTVPTTGTYRIEAIGARGANSSYGSGGRGARMQGDIALTGSTTLKILVGQQGSIGPANNGYGENGGGGGSFVATSANVPLVVAGGGGGAVGSQASCGLTQTTADAVTTTSGVSVSCGGYTSNGGTAGNGGSANNGSNTGGTGGGFNTNGANGGGHCATAPGGQAFVNGGIGGDATSTSCYSPKPHGGFGGGGVGALGGAGGGGGYSGGGASGNWASNSPPGGGGGSFLAGSATNTVTQTQVGTGDGSVTITYIGP